MSSALRGFLISCATAAATEPNSARRSEAAVALLMASADGLFLRTRTISAATAPTDAANTTKQRRVTRGERECWRYKNTPATAAAADNAICSAADLSGAAKAFVAGGAPGPGRMAEPAEILAKAVEILQG